MTVNESCDEAGLVRCVWFCDDHRIASYPFHLDALELARESIGSSDQQTAESEDPSIDPWAEESRDDGDPSEFDGDPEDYHFAGLTGPEAMAAWRNLS